MLKDIFKNAEHRMTQAVEHSRSELSKVRTGRANPDVLNSIYPIFQHHQVIPISIALPYT